MKLEYLCASLNRDKGLKRLEQSADAPFHVQIETVPRAIWRFWGDLVRSSDADIMAIVNDYLEIAPGCADAIRRTFDEQFPDTDGVMGLYRSKQSGFDGPHLVIGKKFIERFPNRVFFCPEYWHFWSDREFWAYAKSMDKAVVNPDAMVIVHEFEPGDTTYKDSRKYKKQDLERWNARQKAGLLWGRTFELLGEEV